MKVRFSATTRSGWEDYGEIGNAIARELRSVWSTSIEFLQDTYRAVTEPPAHAADVAICTVGRMEAPRDAASWDVQDVKNCCHANYTYPRLFVEREAAAMVRDRKGGLVIVLGSNAAWPGKGKAGAEDYAAMKSALRTYLGIRAQSLKQHGIRICLLDLGGVASVRFWDIVHCGTPGLVANVVPGDRVPMTLHEVAVTVAAIVALPSNVVLGNALVVSTDYQ